MGIEYTIYAEIYIKDKWYSIDSHIFTPAGECKLSPLLWGLSDVREFLENINYAQKIKFPDLAESTQNHVLKRANENELSQDERLSLEFDVYDYYSAVKSKYRREYQYEYYVLRHSVVAFETGKTDEIDDWLTKESYEELLPEEKKDYVFFKWTAPNSWHRTLTDIITRVEMRLSNFYELASLDNGDLQEYLQYTNPIRLVVEMG